MDAPTARRTLLVQHDEIRMQLATCGAIARCLRGGDPLHRELDRAFAELRALLDAHNRGEADLIRAILADASAWGEALVKRMSAEHAGEHTAIGDLLIGSVDEVAARIDDLIEELDAHMAAEERTFLSPQVLRPDAIRRHAKPGP